MVVPRRRHVLLLFGRRSASSSVRATAVSLRQSVVRRRGVNGMVQVVINAVRGGVVAVATAATMDTSRYRSTTVRVGARLGRVNGVPSTSSGGVGLGEGSEMDVARGAAPRGANASGVVRGVVG